jgi:hypothetical protein
MILYRRSLVAIALASLALLASASANAQILDPLAKCIKEAVSQNPPQVVKNQFIVGKAVTVSIVCSGDTARDLYQIMGKWATSKAGPQKWENNEVAEYRYFGSISQCRRQLEDATGRTSERYACWVMLDLDSTLIPGIGNF